MPQQLLWTGRDFATICENAELDGVARAVLAQHPEPRGYVDALIEQDQHRAAVSVLAHALPTREAIFWAWSCAREAAGPSPGEGTQRCLAVTRAWIYEPTDAHRRATYVAALEDNFESAASLACAAAFCSGGSLAPDNMPAVLPGPCAAARAIRDCIVMAATIGKNADTIADRYRAFLAEGVKIAARTKALEAAPQQTTWSQMRA
jgi:hypothetical protein